MVEVKEALQHVEKAIAQQATYEEVVNLLDACATLSDAKRAEYAIAAWRVTVALYYNRTAEECETALLGCLKLNPTLLRRATETLAVCADHPELARCYLPQLITDLEASSQDDAITEILATAYNLRDDHLSDCSLPLK